MNALIRWLGFFRREKILLLFSIFFLLLGAKASWYQLPPQVLEVFKFDLSLADLGRRLAIALTLINILFFFEGISNRVARWFSGIALVLVLLFPYVLTNYLPVVSFVSSTYYQQGVEVDQHIEQNFSEVQAQWKQNILLGKPTEVPSEAEATIQDNRFFQLSSWDKILTNWFGYNNGFLAFISMSWLFTIIGLLISLLAYYLSLDSQSLETFLSDIKKFLPITILFIGVLMLVTLIPNLISHQLDVAFAKGNYQQVIETSTLLEHYAPPLKGDKHFVTRMAKAQFYINRTDPALLFFVKGLEHYQQDEFLEAEDYFEKALESQSENFLIRGYLAASILNQGINYFNDSETHRSAAAINEFEHVLQIFPGHLEALYDLMLARAVNGEFDQSALLAQAIINNQKYTQRPRESLLGQAYLHLSWADYQNGKPSAAWEGYRKSVDNSTWAEEGRGEES